jgi:hypothetical protein
MNWVTRRYEMRLMAVIGKLACAGLAALTTLGCATSAPERAGDSPGYADFALAAKHPNLLQRNGRSLTVAGQRFDDTGNCNLGDCTRHRADAVWHDRYVGLEVTRYEDADYLLLGAGDPISLGARPIASPSGKRFFAGTHDDRWWTPNQGASVWEWEPLPRRLRVVDTNLVAFDSFVGWRGESCVEFRGARGYNVRPEPVRTFWLVEREGDWQLTETRPAECR